MRVILHRDIARVLKNNRNQGSGTFRREQATHVFEANPIRSNGGCLAGSFGIVSIGVPWGDGVDEIDDGFHPDLAQLMQLLFKLLEIVPAIGSSCQGYAVGDDALDQQPHHRMGQFFEGAGAVHAAVVSQAGAAEVFGSLAQPDPWILFMLADVFLDHDRDEKFHGFEAHPVHLRRDRQHRPGSHAQRPETLLPIAQRGIDEVNLAHA